MARSQPGKAASFEPELEGVIWREADFGTNEVCMLNPLKASTAPGNHQTPRFPCSVSWPLPGHSVRTRKEAEQLEPCSANVQER